MLLPPMFARERAFRSISRRRSSLRFLPKARRRVAKEHWCHATEACALLGSRRATGSARLVPYHLVELLAWAKMTRAKRRSRP